MAGKRSKQSAAKTLKTYGEIVAELEKPENKGRGGMKRAAAALGMNRRTIQRYLYTMQSRIEEARQAPEPTPKAPGKKVTYEEMAAKYPEMAGPLKLLPNEPGETPAPRPLLGQPTAPEPAPTPAPVSQPAPQTDGIGEPQPIKTTEPAKKQDSNSEKDTAKKKKEADREAAKLAAAEKSASLSRAFVGAAAFKLFSNAVNETTGAGEQSAASYMPLVGAIQQLQRGKPGVF